MRLIFKKDTEKLINLNKWWNYIRIFIFFTVGILTFLFNHLWTREMQAKWSKVLLGVFIKLLEPHLRIICMIQTSLCFHQNIAEISNKYLKIYSKWIPNNNALMLIAKKCKLKPRKKVKVG